MKVRFPSRFVKTVVLLAAAIVYVPLVIDWCAPGQGLHQATIVLGGCGSDIYQASGATHWGSLVRWIGWNLRGLGTLSMLGALVSLGLIAISVDMIMVRTVFNARFFRDANHELIDVASLSVVLVSAAFVVEPGLLRAATRPDPLMVVLVAPLLSMMLAVRILTEPGDAGLAQKAHDHPWMVQILLLSLAYGGWCFIHLTPALLLEYLGHLLWFLVLGGLPLLLLIKILQRGIPQRRFQICYFRVWAAVIALVAVVSVGKFNRGWKSNRMAAQILMNSDGCAFTKDEMLNDLFIWMQKENKRFPVPEWSCDQEGGKRVVATEVRCFPTVDLWHEAWRYLAAMDDNEPLRDCYRNLLGICGNELGCQLIEKGQTGDAWVLFWEVLDKVDRVNYPAIMNLCGLVGGDHPQDPAAVERLGREFLQMLAQARTIDGLSATVGIGGRIHVDSEAKNREVVKLVRQAISRLLSCQAIQLSQVDRWIIEIDIHLGDWPAVERDALDILRLDGQDVFANTVMGKVCARKGDYPGSERHFRRALASGPGDNPEALNGLAFVLARTGHPSEAVRLSRPLALAYPENWEFRETLALALIKSGSLEDGDRELKAAANLARTNKVPSKDQVRLVVDLAWLFKKRNDVARVKRVLEVLDGQTGIGEGIELEIKAITEGLE